MSEMDEKEIKSRFELISQFEPGSEATIRDLKRVRESLVKRITKQQTTQQKMWRIIMKSKITKFAAAAAIIIAVLIGIHYSGGSIDGANVAWADVMEQISSFRPYACTNTVHDEGAQISYRRMRLSLTQRREIRSNGVILVFDLSIPKSLTLIPEKKHAIEKTYDMSPASDPDIFRMANSMQNAPSGSNVQEVNIREIDGHVAKGFRSKGEYNDITIWADVQTKLPVRVEIIHVKTGRKIIISEFEFDVDFDESLFSTTAPEGYTVKKIEKGEVSELTKFKRSTTEEDLVEGLRALAIFLDGRFPPEIELEKIRVSLKEYIKQNNLSDSEVEKRLAPVSKNYTKAYWYIRLLKGEMEVSDFHYAGEGVKLGDSETPVIWWLPKDSETYRVIYGDLSVADVAPENLLR